jgi:hypothetical protein
MVFQFFYGRWFSTVFLAVPVLVPPKGSIARSFFASDFVRRATSSCTQVSAFLGYLLVILLWSPLWIHSYSASFGIVMVIIAQTHACMPCEAL